MENTLPEAQTDKAGFSKIRAYLWKRNTQVVIADCQPHGSLGRMLVEGQKVVRTFGKRIAVRADVHTLGGFSAHAGQNDLLAWFKAEAPSRPRLVLVHGEDNARIELASSIRKIRHKAISAGQGRHR
jgi:metallo-beta-lactamase family protein